MAKMKPTQRIFDVMKDIVDGKYRLPSIQRSFVWDEARLCKLMDSIMSDYPIGSFLVWKPPENLRIRTRTFVKTHETRGVRPIAEEPISSAPYLVLDGQQRLQSLYLSFFGTFDTRHLYFKVDSNPAEEHDHLRYDFQLLTPEEAGRDGHWIRPQEIIEIGIPKLSAFVDRRFSSDSEPTRERIKENLAKFIQLFNIDEGLPFLEVTEDMPYNDVLEVFVRVNSGGMRLAKSDLVFSTIVLNSPDMERKFVELIDELNGGGEFDFDLDFIIKTSLVVFNKGAKYDVGKLEDNEYLTSLGKGFENLRDSLLSTVEFLKTDAKILAKRFLKSDLALIPIVDFTYRQPHQQIPDGQTRKLRQYLYMSFLMRFYSYGADGKLDVIHKQITEYEKPQVFPLKRISKYMSDRTGTKYSLSNGMLKDLDLILNIVQGGVAEIPQKRGWSLERDHIFPASLLQDKGISDETANSIGNLRLINKTRNIMKSDKLPAEDIEFFGSTDSTIRKLFSDVRKDLTSKRFEDFVRAREGIVVDRANEFLQFER
jgi:hypothetical protein